MAKKVLVFGDIGVDDTIALIYAHLNDEIDLVGIVADYGNVPREVAVGSVHYLFDLFGIKNVPIIVGAEAPMTGETPTYYPEVHGEYGLGPITPGQYEGVIENFFEIVDIIHTYKDELIILNVGRLTALATMFILYRSLMEEVKEYYIMGGAFWVPGNVTAVSEANFHADPVAVKIVLNYADNVKIIPLNVTDHAIVTPEMADYIGARGKVKMVKQLLDYYYDFYKKRNPDIKGSPVHDVLTMMAILHPEMFHYQKLPVYIDTTTTGILRGQSIADIRPYIEFEETAQRHDIAFQFDYSLFFKDFMNIMTGEAF
ncbi:purine nucleosidase [Halobacillus karajensis]|uniref:Pyrimidine-specific ribonucleoside hydrolase RihA n=1 Tax=Halobacillus karajensis TaxID=195088 RepID=A0A024P9T8_9BACI|nr:nucleoside hydrolase [Halobacillus karajensis]CDQ20162.1 Pyrimidine-specific ribonucleoside hydrolase RihA [Halobacillus karajensis]CDQ25177.1 Pyrimidine-specific ribonucleoside hydrolase RihA [Halobacillus karajensis]CDQ28462.1 Pyrimidine-specific ribonucleoside hydrolase RihA [Halobacillus karajensis]SEI01425.1 purine nucleosidase [Halobacillus karajensis]